MNGEFTTIVNITEQSYAAHRTYGTFLIAGAAGASKIGSVSSVADGPAKPAGLAKPYALTRITPRTAVMDYGDKRTVPLPISAWEIANDLCREINSDAGEQSFLGVFVCAGSEPTEAELREARAKLDEFYRALVAAADREWERSHSYLFIHDLQRRAAANLGLEKEWYYRAQEMDECPGCGDRVKPGVAKCKSCGAILDREKAVALGLVAPGVTQGVAQGVPVPGAVTEKAQDLFSGKQAGRR
jgi:hypothetical protein